MEWSFTYIGFLSKALTIIHGKWSRELASTKYFVIILKDNSFEYIQDDEIKIEKWENIKSPKIRSNYISINLNSGDNYLFPAKSR